jgi:phosphoribosylformylglycinamidine synthase subunit PurQ / glutaminase
MKVGVVVFPGTNREKDMAYALQTAGASLGHPVDPLFIWHQETEIPAVEGIFLAGGFSYGDYLRSGAMAARSPIMSAIIQAAEKGMPVLGVCNGFQILCEAGLLEGVLMRNQHQKFMCKRVHLRIEQTNTPFTAAYKQGQVIDVPIAHGDGNFIAQEETLKRLEGEGQVLFRYCSALGELDSEFNPNGSLNHIAGITNKHRNVVGMMPHPENHVDDLQGTQDGLALFQSFIQSKKECLLKV